MHYNIFTVGFRSTKVTVWEYSHAALLHLFEIKNSILEEIGCIRLERLHDAGVKISLLCMTNSKELEK